MDLAKQLVLQLRRLGKTVSTAESCTGGLIAKLITDIAGSSAVFYGGCVSYTNLIKEKVLGVDPEIIRTHTEVSYACAAAMAEGAKTVFGTDIGISTTGYAGPDGGNEQDPVGTVYLAICTTAGTRTERFTASAGADREQVRTEAALRALELVLTYAEE